MVRYGEAAGRWVLFATVLGTGIAFIDATVVNIALPHIGDALHADAASLQWTINGYTLSLAALILLGGSLGDRFGRRRTFLVGVVWFAAASLLCGLAPNIETLVGARILQGVGGALLTPGALAIIQASFVPEDRSRAIGAWSGLGGIAGAVGPFIGGWLVQAASWRYVFLINVPLAVLVIAVAWRHVPESRDTQMPPKLDIAGVVLGAIGLGGLTYGFTAWSSRGPGDPVVFGTLIVGVACLVGFVLQERRSPHPMLPLSVFRSRAFAADNLVTFVVYGALGGVMFLLVLQLQVVAGFEPLAAGLALAERIGPRIPMTVGPLVMAAGLLWLSRIGPHASYLSDVLPPVIVQGLGLSVTVAPLTATALGSVDDRHAGIASGVNNAVARAAGLLAVAVLPLAAGLGSGTLTDPVTLAPTYKNAMMISAGLLVVGAVISVIGIPAKITRKSATPVRSHCAISGPPLHPEGAGSR